MSSNPLFPVDCLEGKLQVMTSLPLGECCFKVTFQQGTPQGRFKTFNSVNTYVTKNFLTESARYLIVFSDVFGVDLVNAHLISDNYAEALG